MQKIKSLGTVVIGHWFQIIGSEFGVFGRKLEVGSSEFKVQRSELGFQSKIVNHPPIAIRVQRPWSSGKLVIPDSGIYMIQF
jgi:hypothetical protein